MLTSLQERIESELRVTDNAFKPDQWTFTFQKGLMADRKNLEGCGVVEVGVGTGANAIVALEALGVSRFYGSDLDPTLPILAQENVDHLLPQELAKKFSPLHGETNLLATPEISEIVKNGVRAVIACIPQAILPISQEKHPDDLAHYYPEKLFEKYPFNLYALGLNEALLIQFRKLIEESGDYGKLIYLNLGGRVGKKRLLELFTSNGFEPEIVHETIIPQCPTTNLQFFVDTERLFGIVEEANSRIIEYGRNYQGQDYEPFQCEFFADSEGIIPISAVEAEARRISHLPLFHKIYVIKGKVKKNDDDEVLLSDEF